ncbi:MAG: tyrosine-type recombinase/integrase [Symploca sp. SIO1C4]|uniref:Tyrosine-type recombinase/integrase n=1 Tax=Symploca sp. SIO1C4 TaxID=2607765 RepID=A0A6B3N715_9CYAN|nr:tyrosine-type recombinase/integrase [Symploca sp. SIO1C4]
MLSKNTQKEDLLEDTFHVTIGESFPDLTADIDVIEELISQHRSPHTRKAYEKDIRLFLTSMSNKPFSRDLVYEFLHLEEKQAKALLLKYKALMLAVGENSTKRSRKKGVRQKPLTEATVNRRLAAVKALVKYARKQGICTYSLEDVEGERTASYRDTSGVEVADIQKMMAIPDRTTLKGKRDYAIMRLLWDNALRASEILQCNIGDLDIPELTLSILGKGKGTQKQHIDLSPKAALALQDWLLARGETNTNSPLFVSVDTPTYGHRLTHTGLYKNIRKIAKTAGIKKTISPHRWRHSAITESLNQNNGNIQATQKLSRHADPKVVNQYDDNRKRLQKNLTYQLADLV